ncbi:MAG: hypothetical protein ACRAVC_00045 [Trichormus sp.]
MHPTFLMTASPMPHAPCPMPNSQFPMPNCQSLDIIVSTPQAAKLADEQMVTLSYVSRLALRNLLLFVCNRSQPEGINVRIATESE